MIEEFDETLPEADEQEVKQKVAHILVEIEEAIRIGYMVQDKFDSESVYLVAKDMLDGEFLPVPKDVVAELFADNQEMYNEWKADFDEYKEKRKEAEKNFALPKSLIFGRFKKKDNQ